MDVALQSYDKVSVSLYDTLGKDSVGKSYPPLYVDFDAHINFVEYM